MCVCANVNTPMSHVVHGTTQHISDLDSRSTPQVFYTYFYNHAHRTRLEKLFQLGLSRSFNGHFYPLPNPDGGFASETAARRFRK